MAEITAISAKSLFYRYENAPTDAVKGVDITINKGEFVGFLGHNGSGKSTLGKLFNGLCYGYFFHCKKNCCKQCFWTIRNQQFWIAQNALQNKLREAVWVKNRFVKIIYVHKVIITCIQKNKTFFLKAEE